MRRTLPLLAGAAALVVTGTAAAAKDVNIYSYRQAVLMKPLLDRFEQKTGIEAHVVYLKKGMIARLEAEGAASPADVILTVDAARLIRLDRMGAFQPLDSAAVNAAVPANLRHTKGHWFGLTVRGRPIFYNPAKVKASELSTYEALADGKWKGRICIRSSSNVYNQSLIASIIAANGVKEAAGLGQPLRPQFRPQAGRRRPRPDPRRRGRRMRYRHRQHLLLCRPRQIEEGTGPQSRRRRPPVLAEPERRRRRGPGRACQHLRRRHREAFQEPGQRRQADRVPGEPRGPGDLRPHRQRIPGAQGCPTRPDRRRFRRVQGGFAGALRTGAIPERGRAPRGPRRLAVTARRQGTIAGKPARLQMSWTRLATLTVDALQSGADGRTCASYFCPGTGMPNWRSVPSRVGLPRRTRSSFNR